jgi:hypothetical protein
VRQVAALERGMPNLPSKDATEGEVIRRLEGLLAKGTTGVGLHTMPQHAIRRPNAPLHCEPDVDLALGWGPCLPNCLATGEELQPEEESLVSRT